MKDPRSIIRTLDVTEKGTRLIETERKYFMIVDPSSNKIEIKKAVEELFRVKVAKVNTMNYRGKLKRERTQNFGARSDWKRAIVTLKEGEKIELTQ